MRVLDIDRDVAVDNVIVFLKQSEAKELYNALGDIIKSNDYNMHVHVSEDTYQREITVLLYSDDLVSSLNERSRRLIIEGD